jgi:hypothetical protein
MLANQFLSLACHSGSKMHMIHVPYVGDSSSKPPQIHEEQIQKKKIKYRFAVCLKTSWHSYRVQREDPTFTINSLSSLTFPLESGIVPEILIRVDKCQMSTVECTANLILYTSISFHIANHFVKTVTSSGVETAIRTIQSTMWEEE